MLRDDEKTDTQCAHIDKVNPKIMKIQKDTKNVKR
jgi:hypothetical protein